ncbi:glutamine synthetase [Actinophytocola xinjiangensis]|uniref:Glutamine synthetase n=1 Tax=Actinophytocola xinjiangensis TaxID=485602 RepID=A0A7Z0WN78_9PSEU|nr:glutamine synthetase [Actinophytocola xinjiangensis]
MTVQELIAEVDAGGIDTVVMALVDMQGRLQGKRFHSRHFVDEILAHGSESSNYLLAVDVEMNPVPGYRLANWETGYGDFTTRPDVATLRRIPWQPGTALLLADPVKPDGADVAVAPREILRRQLDRLAGHALTAQVATEVEFVLYRESYGDAQRRGYRDLTPATRYNVDYSLLGTDLVEPLLRRIRNEMAGAGLVPESAKGECNLGQHEIAFRYADALTTADQHTIYKHGAKEIAAQEGMSITFMAKPNEREGNSCHIHFSVRDADGTPAMPGAGPGHLSVTGQRVAAGLLATMPDFSLLYAPHVNSYKRYAPGSFAPTAIRWGVDNRTCAVRVAGHGTGVRLENRAPGADVNPHLAIAAMIAGAVHGLERELTPETVFSGNAYADEAAPRVPATLRDALARWEASEVVREVFGPEVTDHYANNARIELAAFDAAVTDWELARGFERL